MDDTQSTLLARLRDRADQEAWRTFDELYRPMLVRYARARGLEPADADDVAQQCTQAVLEQIGPYQHAASFKSWLRAIAENKVCDRFRRRRREVQAGTDVWDQHADSAGGADPAWEQQWSVAHLRHCAEIARRDVAPRTYAAFAAYALEGRPVAEVAASLGMSLSAVYVSKHRVVERMRALMRELTGSDELEL
jgi:RNA polymerase sigma-70 factor (ECF subfamily)